MTQLIDLTNQRYGNLTAISYIGRKNHITYWLFKCDCGKETTASSSKVRSGNKTHCGCKKLQPGQASLNNLFYKYKRGANRRNIEFDISFEDFSNLVFKNCFYCNIPPYKKYQPTGFNGGIIYNGVDRFLNEIGYSKENCVTCCKTCNLAKVDKFSGDEFKLMMDYRRSKTIKLDLWEGFRT